MAPGKKDLFQPRKCCGTTNSCSRGTCLVWITHCQQPPSLGISNSELKDDSGTDPQSFGISRSMPSAPPWRSLVSEDVFPFSHFSPEEWSLTCPSFLAPLSCVLLTQRMLLNTFPSSPSRQFPNFPARQHQIISAPPWLPFLIQTLCSPCPPRPARHTLARTARLFLMFRLSPLPFAAAAFQKEPKFCLVEMTVISRTLYTLLPRHLEFSAPVVSVASLISLLGHVH